jgi:hypothetical protein
MKRKRHAKVLDKKDLPLEMTITRSSGATPNRVYSATMAVFRGGQSS